MIIDSHVHYIYPKFRKTFFYIDNEADGQHSRIKGTREELLEKLRENGVACCVEPAIGLRSNDDVLALSEQYEGFIFPAVGAHPTRVPKEKWRDRKRLDMLAQHPRVVAIGETGLDYHHERRKQHRFCQLCWFLYQLGLAKRTKLPLILHVRQAHADALRVLKRHPAVRNGGVVHCFCGDQATAMQYVGLGLHLGIGGKLLQHGEEADALRDAVRQVPLSSLLIETDAPFVPPDYPAEELSKHKCNTSLILPDVIREIAALKGIPEKDVERVTADNAIRLFSLPIENDL